MGTLGELKRSTYVEFSFPVCVSHGRAAGRRPRTGTVQNNYTLFFPAVPGSATKTAQNHKGKEKKRGAMEFVWLVYSRCWALVMGRLSCRHGTVMPVRLPRWMAPTAFPHITGPFC